MEMALPGISASKCLTAVMLETYNNSHAFTRICDDNPCCAGEVRLELQGNDIVITGRRAMSGLLHHCGIAI